MSRNAPLNGYGYLPPGRLQDVLALIQVLGLGATARRSESQLMDVLQSAPASGISRWSEVALRHPEFFRVSGQNKDSVCLAARHAAGERDEERILPDGFADGLMRLAIEIHDRQARRAKRWTLYLPLVVAIIGAIGSIVTTLIVLTFRKGI